MLAALAERHNSTTEAREAFVAARTLDEALAIQTYATATETIAD